MSSNADLIRLANCILEGTFSLIVREESSNTLDTVFGYQVIEFTVKESIFTGSIS